MNPTPKFKAQNSNTETPLTAPPDEYSDNAKYQEIINMIRPLVNPLDEDGDYTDEDVRVCWNVRMERGKKHALVHLNGSRTIQGVLKPENLSEGYRSMNQLLEDNITRPIVACIQAEVQRVAFEDLAAKEKAAAELDILMDD